MKPEAPTHRGRKARARSIAAPKETSLLDVIDNLLSQGVVLQGDAVLGVADVDLIYLRLSVLLCAMDRVGPAPGASAVPR